MDNLSSREKIMVIGGGVIAVVFIAIQFICLPAYDKKNELKKSFETEIESLERVNRLRKEYLALVPDHSIENGFVQNREDRFTLFSFIDQKASRSKIKGNIDYMKPDTRDLKNSPFALSIVKLKLKQVSLKDFIRFIQEVEAEGEGIRLVSLSLNKSGKEKKWLDAVIEVQTLVAKENGA